MTYEERSEFERLKHADVAQGKRIAELTEEIATQQASAYRMKEMLARSLEQTKRATEQSTKAMKLVNIAEAAIVELTTRLKNVTT